MFGISEHICGICFAVGCPRLDADKRKQIAYLIRLQVGNTEITLVLPHQNTDVSLTCDGHEVFSVREDDVIKVREGQSRVLFVRNPGRSFIEVLRDKLSWAGGFNA